MQVGKPSHIAAKKVQRKPWMTIESNIPTSQFQSFMRMLQRMDSGNTTPAAERKSVLQELSPELRRNGTLIELILKKRAEARALEKNKYALAIQELSEAMRVKGIIRTLPSVRKAIQLAVKELRARQKDKTKSLITKKEWAAAINNALRQMN